MPNHSEDDWYQDWNENTANENRLLRKALKEGYPIINDYARDNPLFTRPRLGEQDTNGVHAWLRRYKDLLEMK